VALSARVALVAVDLEKKLGPRRHAAADLERYDRDPRRQYRWTDELVGRGLRDQSAGILGSGYGRAG